MRIGVMGGTFNPPHIGHIHAARAARDSLGLDTVVFIPTNIPPHKSLPRTTPSNEDRYAMTELAAQEMGAIVSDVELRRNGPSYTADTLEILRQEYPKDEFYFIIGTDMFLTIQDWRDPERIFRQAHIAVVARGKQDKERIAQHEKKIRKLGAIIEIVPVQAIEISSTKLRENIRKPEYLAYLPRRVHEYIAWHDLYR